MRQEAGSQSPPLLRQARRTPPGCTSAPDRVSFSIVFSTDDEGGPARLLPSLTVVRK